MEQLTERNRPRSFEYGVSSVELELDAYNEGSRISAVGVMFQVDSSNVTVENFGIQPVNLIGIRKTD